LSSGVGATALDLGETTTREGREEKGHREAREQGRGNGGVAAWRWWRRRGQGVVAFAMEECRLDSVLRRLPSLGRAAARLEKQNKTL
jgi:hypothetical protein